MLPQTFHFWYFYIDGTAFYISDNKVVMTEGIDGVVSVDYFQKIESWPSRQQIHFWFLYTFVFLVDEINISSELQ